MWAIWCGMTGISWISSARTTDSSTPILPPLYKVTAPPRDFDRVQFPAEQGRAGVLGQALFLTLTSKPEETAPTSRGLFVREQFLCQQVPPPPPGVDTNLPPIEESLPRNNRERLASHTTNKACSSCHALIDPIGFAFEKFDAVGMYHAKPKLLFYPDEHEAKVPKKEVLLDVDTSGQVAGVPNSEFTGCTAAWRAARRVGAVSGMRGQAGLPLHFRQTRCTKRRAGYP